MAGEPVHSLRYGYTCDSYRNFKRLQTTGPRCQDVRRLNLGEILDQLVNQHTRFLVKRSGIPAAVLMSLRDYEAL
jgi:hypothetical protein